MRPRLPLPPSSSFSLFLWSRSPILGTRRPQCPLQTARASSVGCRPELGGKDTPTGGNKAPAARPQLSGWVAPPRRGPGVHGTRIGFRPVTTP